MKRIVLLLLLIPISLTWGLSFLVTTVTVKEVDPVPLLAMRWGLAGILCLLLMIFGVITLFIPLLWISVYRYATLTAFYQDLIVKYGNAGKVDYGLN